MMSSGIFNAMDVAATGMTAQRTRMGKFISVRLLYFRQILM